MKIKSLYNLFSFPFINKYKCTFFTGKRYVSTIPVKLIRAQNAGRNTHLDSQFAPATIEYLKDLAMLFGSKSVFVISQDDKARVPLGLPAAKKQALLLMHLEYRSELPDHDFVIAENINEFHPYMAY
ncbi:unnamed protein product [Adineta steineri]|uniref:Uncharacterized protein n=1 Tax=Adineta steineri TaxID=433720 RepID=A0A820HXK6_9BILA|nr:unnamed protein product [Adineta steineri]